MSVGKAARPTSDRYPKALIQQDLQKVAGAGISPYRKHEDYGGWIAEIANCHVLALSW